MESCVQLPLDEKLLHDLVEKAKDFLLMHGKIHLIEKNAFSSNLLKCRSLKTTLSHKKVKSLTLICKKVLQLFVWFDLCSGHLLNEAHHAFRPTTSLAMSYVWTLSNEILYFFHHPHLSFELLLFAQVTRLSCLAF